MSGDRYTKLVLTVIALCLIWLCASSTGLPLQAAQKTHGLSGPPQPVVIVGWGTMDDKGSVSVTMMGSGTTSDPNVPVKIVGLPLDPIEVRLPYNDAYPLPVGVTSIKRVGEWEPIRSAVEGEPVRPKPGR